MQYYMLQNIFTYFKNQNWEYKKIIRNSGISKVKVDVIDGRSVWVESVSDTQMIDMIGCIYDVENPQKAAL